MDAAIVLCKSCPEMQLNIQWNPLKTFLEKCNRLCLLSRKISERSKTENVILYWNRCFFYYNIFMYKFHVMLIIFNIKQHFKSYLCLFILMHVGLRAPYVLCWSLCSSSADFVFSRPYTQLVWMSWTFWSQNTSDYWN